MRKKLIALGLSIAFLLLVPQAYASQIDVTLKGKAYRYKWGGFENAVMTIEGVENEQIENEYIENLTATVRVPATGENWKFDVSGSRVHYHISLESTHNERDFGIVPPYAMRSTYFGEFGFGRYTEDFYTGMPTKIAESKYGKLGGADFSGYKIENYWHLTGTIVDDNGDNLFKSFRATSFIVENRGSMGPPPSGSSYVDYVKTFTYYRVALISEIIDTLNNLEDGLFWDAWGAFLTNRYDIVRQVRGFLEEYVP